MQHTQIVLRRHFFLPHDAHPTTSPKESQRHAPFEDAGGEPPTSLLACGMSCRSFMTRMLPEFNLRRSHAFSTTHRKFDQVKLSGDVGSLTRSCVHHLSEVRALQILTLWQEHPVRCAMESSSHNLTGSQHYWELWWIQWRLVSRFALLRAQPSGPVNCHATPKLRNRRPQIANYTTTATSTDRLTQQIPTLAMTSRRFLRSQAERRRQPG